MRWRKLGQVFRPEGSLPWMRTHAALPFAVPLQGALHRVYFSARDEKNRSSIGFVDVEIGTSPRVERVCDRPVLSLGPAGAFDDSGIGLGCIVVGEQETRLYYMGWNLGVTAPWRNSIGLALGHTKGATFERYSPGPIMDRSPSDPYTLSYPWVVRTEDGVWHMWYGSNLTWGAKASDMSHAIKHATSADGVEWKREKLAVLEPDDKGTYAFARPCVVRDRDRFCMWYAYRGSSYRIGYADSVDGLAWTRRDAEVGIAPSMSGWDADMLCYPSVFDHAGVRYMLYNGNGYGATGFGLAILEKS